MTLDDIELP